MGDELSRLTSAASPPVLELGEWADSALCKGMPLEWFFPEKGGHHRLGKQVCKKCPVTEECLRWALVTQQPDGLWGGMTTRERVALLAARGIPVLV